MAGGYERGLIVCWANRGNRRITLKRMTQCHRVPLALGLTGRGKGVSLPLLQQ